MLKTILLICIILFTTNQLTMHAIVYQKHYDLQYKGISGDFGNDYWNIINANTPYYFGCGAQLQFQKAQGSTVDDTAANGLRIKFCDSLDWSDQYSSQISGEFGDWKGMKMCEPFSYIKGFQVRYQDNMGTGDNTGLNGLKIICRTPFDYLAKMDSTKEVMVYEGLQGNWKPASQDKTNFMQGFKIQYQKYSSNYDSTGMNGLNFRMEPFNLRLNK